MEKIQKKKIQEIQEELIDRAGTFAGSLGLNSAVGQIYALLFFYSDPLSLQDIAKLCHMSKGNASINLRELEKWGAVYKVRVRGDRKDYYKANTDIGQILCSKLKIGLDRRLAEAENILKNAKDALKRVSSNSMDKTEREKVEEYIAKINLIEEFTKKIKLLLDNLDKLQSILS